MELTTEKPIRVKDAASILGLHEQTIYKYMREGTIPKKYIHRVGRNLYFIASELQQFIKQS
jgi:excisionase family DNA binding protein